ncbi:MAG: hypothetical protein AAGJ81_12715 [Verrucomicrobiota bacterium]
MNEFLTRPHLFAYLAIIFTVIRYFTYIVSIQRGETHPHVFSWLNLGVISLIATVAQFHLGGGPSAWVLGAKAVVSLYIAFVSLFIGEKRITKSDWIAFLSALVIIPIWLWAKSPLTAILLVMCIDFLSFLPTYRKSWRKPWSEPPVSYFWAGLRYFLTLFAIPEPTFATLLFPAFLLASDWVFMIFLIWRRRVLRSTKPQESQGHG